MNKEKFYITTSIAYANSSPHIGFALELVQADFLARYHRARGDNTYFLTGTDEHGDKVARTAKENKQTPTEFAKKITEEFRVLTKDLNISIDDFIRTSDQKKHWPGVIEMWNRLVNSDDVYKKDYIGKYCVGCEAYKTEKELVNGKCPDHPNLEIEERHEENYFFALSKYENYLKKLYRENPEFVYPKSRYNEMLEIIDSGLEDISISRSKEKLSWGVPVPGDETQVMYVWVDALTNYISALGFPQETNKFKTYWPADIHVVGKDINRFHSILWPAMLESANLARPKQILVHGFITSKGQKISKSLGNVINPSEEVKKYGVDAVRFFLLSEISFFEDGDYTKERFEEAYNSSLANGIGNFAQRVSSMVDKYLDGKTPEGKVIKGVNVENFDKLVNKLEINKALNFTKECVTIADRYVEENKPWELAKTDKKKLSQVLGDLVATINEINKMLVLIIPETSEKIDKIFSSSKIKTGKPLFPRLEG